MAIPILMKKGFMEEWKIADRQKQLHKWKRKDEGSQVRTKRRVSEKQALRGESELHRGP